MNETSLFYGSQQLPKFELIFLSHWL